MDRMDSNNAGKDSICYGNHFKQTQLQTKGTLEVGAMLSMQYSASIQHLMSATDN